MSILIKGMEMPTDGEAVVLVISNENGKMLAEVDEYCGAVYESVPVPKHGRLIDADALEEWLFDDNPNPMKAPFRLCTADRTDVKFLMKKAPTIIPASEEGE